MIELEKTVKKLNKLILKASKFVKVDQEEKKYISAQLKFIRDEIMQMPKDFRKLFRSCGSSCNVRKYIEGVYELRFFRFGYCISVSSNSLILAKQLFFSELIKLYV